MLCLREVLLWSAIACSVSPVPLGGAHGLFRLCKKPHFMDYEYPRPTTAATPPADHPVTTNKYHTVVPTTAAPYTTAEPASPLPALPPQQEVPYFPQQVFFPPQHGVHDPSEQQVSYAQQHDVAPYLPQLQYVVSGPPQQYASPNPPPPPQQQQQQQQQVLYPPQPEVLDPSSPPQYPVPNLPQQEVAQNPPTQQNEAQYPPPQQQQPVQNLTPTQPEAQYPPPQQQQEAQYPPQQQQQQQQQAQNPPPGYYQGVPSNDMYGPPDYGYYQQPQQQATSPFKKSLGHLTNHKFANDQRPFTVYVQQPYPYDFYPTRLYYQLSQALRKPQFSHPAIKSKL